MKSDNIISRISTTWREMVTDDAEKSLLSRAESNAIKGILIILIVLGHNKYIMQGGMSNIYLYSFHVYAFYYLPFLYNFKKMTWVEFFRKNLRRLYVPYTIFFCILLFISISRGQPQSTVAVLSAYICGSQAMLSATFGFGSFLWFLPTMLSILMFRQIYYRLGYWGRNIILLLSAMCLFGFTYMIPLYVVTWWYCPFCLTVALAMIFPAVCLRYVVQCISQQAVVLIFFLLTISLMVIYPVQTEYPLSYLTVNRLLCPILIFSMLLTLKHYLVSSNMLVDFGRQSLVIYLTHQFIYNGFYMLSKQHNPGIYTGILIFGLTFVAAYLVSKIKFIKYAFPK